VLPAAEALRRPGGTEVRYRPDSELFYLTGATDPGIVAVFTAPPESRYVLFVPRRDPEIELWSGPRMGPQEAREVLGADEAHPLDELEDRLPGILQSHRKVLYRLGVHPELDPVVLDSLRWARSRGARTGKGPRMVGDPGEALDPLRLVKDPEEIDRFRRAASLTTSVFQEVMISTRPGMGEWEVEALVDFGFRRGGALGAGFPTIVGSGPNACTLHYAANARTITEEDLVLLDGGAEVDLYSADVTRTFPARGRFDEVRRDVYEVVFQAHERAISGLAPGADVAGIHEAAVAELTRGLVDLGVLKGDAGALVEEEAYRPFFPHQTCHWLGLDVHDPGAFVEDSGPRVLRPGMVLTVEPGLYFPVVGSEAGHPYEGVGIRLENDFLVTEEGIENLTSSLPSDVEEVEALLNSKGSD
jgi:Xaa-Pro aminopeptidase